MVLSINPSTYVITVPKADMLLIQSTPIEIRELNLDTFRLNLKDWEDSVAGITHLKTHNHNTTVSISGVELARVITILEPYTITFENGAYAVNLVGANSNVSDRVNLNFVSIRAANSAGLIQTREIEYASFDGGVTIDIVNGISGTDYPQGTPAYPVDNLVDAVFIANLRGFVNLFINESMTLDSGTDISGFYIIGRSHVNTELIMDASAICDGITIRNCNISGTLDGGTHIEDCTVGDINYVNGHIHNSGLYGTLTLAGGEDAVIADCKSIDQDSNPIIDMGATGQDLAMPNFSGIITIQNFSDATGEIGIGLDAGQVTLDSTVTAGTAIISGVGVLVDNSTGATVNTDGLMSKDTIATATWDEDLALHSLTGSTGKVLALTEFGGQVHIDTVNGTSGTAFPQGTPLYPVDNLADALTIGMANGITFIHIFGALTLTSGTDYAGYTFLADRSTGNTLTVTSMTNSGSVYFQDLTISGALTGSTRFTTCVLGALTGFDGGAKDSLLTGSITITGTGANYFTNCDTYVTDATYKEISVGANLLNIIRCRGSFEIADYTGSSSLALDFTAGNCKVASTCVSGVIVVSGLTSLTDESGAGCFVIDGTITEAGITDKVWDELAVDHTDAGSMGKALSDAGSSGNPWATPVSGNTTPGSFGELVGKKLLTLAKFLGLK